MDLGSFIINLLNKIEPITENSQSLLRVSITNHFNEQEQLMENYKKIEALNFEIEQEIEKIPVGLPDEEYNAQVQRLRTKKLPLPKITLFTKVIAFFSKPMAKLFLYVLFIALSMWITKRFLSKTLNPDEDQDDEDDDDQKRKPSKKERKILKKYGKYDEDFR